jgi:hypothetical protein
LLRQKPMLARTPHAVKTPRFLEARQFLSVASIRGCAEELQNLSTKRLVTLPSAKEPATPRKENHSPVYIGNTSNLMRWLVVSKTKTTRMDSLCIAALQVFGLVAIITL